jgi:hypothetical protein
MSKKNTMNTNALEALAERLDELAEIACSRSIYEGSSGPDRELRAAAECVREMKAYEQAGLRFIPHDTDAALAAWRKYKEPTT